jgi:hypothetical protein
VQETVTYDGEHSVAASEYLTLIAALDDLLRRIEAKHGDPRQYSLTIYSNRAPVVKLLQGAYTVRGAALLLLHEQALERLARFAAVELIWIRAAAIAPLFGAAGRGTGP